MGRWQAEWMVRWQATPLPIELLRTGQWRILRRTLLVGDIPCFDMLDMVCDFECVWGDLEDRECETVSWLPKCPPRSLPMPDARGTP